MRWDRELEIAKNVAVKAGEAILEIYNNADIEVEYKKDHSPLTIADKTANKLIVETLRSYFPTYAILSEEEKDDKTRLSNDYCFVVDPLDGTKEFIKRNGQFTVNIALAYQHESVIGVIYVPVTRELYYGAQGYGSFLQSADGCVRKLAVSDNRDMSALRVVISNSHGCKQMDDLIEKYQLTNLLKVGSSLKGCMIAEGKADVYYRFNPTMEWDTAAMQCIAEEAGAIFRQMDDTLMYYNRENSLNEKGFYIISHADVALC